MGRNAGGGRARGCARLVDAQRTCPCLVRAAVSIPEATRFTVGQTHALWSPDARAPMMPRRVIRSGQRAGELGLLLRLDRSDDLLEAVLHADGHLFLPRGSSWLSRWTSSLLSHGRSAKTSLVSRCPRTSSDGGVCAAGLLPGSEVETGELLPLHPSFREHDGNGVDLRVQETRRLASRSPDP